MYDEVHTMRGVQRVHIYSSWIKRAPTPKGFCALKVIVSKVSKVSKAAELAYSAAILDTIAVDESNRAPHIAYTICS